MYPLDKLKAIADARKTSSHSMTYVTRNMTGGWRLELKFYSKQLITVTGKRKTMWGTKVGDAFKTEKCLYSWWHSKRMTGTFQEDHWFTYHVLWPLLSAPHFTILWKDAEVVTLPKPGRNQNLVRTLCLISLLSATFKILIKFIQKIVQTHNEESDVLDVSRFGFRAHHKTTRHCERLSDHVTLNFNNSMSTAAVLCDIEEAFDTAWHHDLLKSYQNYNLRPV
jgi:hypothetical protein